MVSPPPDIDRRVHNLQYPPAWGDGIGLGAELAIVRRLIEQSGGSIRVSGAEGRGTEFILTLARYDLLDYLE